MTTDYAVKPLDPSTWDAFARLLERHNGVFGGCWCTYFHTFHGEKTFTAEGNRTLKKRLVDEGVRAHAALVFDGDEAEAWCQYGARRTADIQHHKEYEATLDTPPDQPNHLHLRRQEIPPQRSDGGRPQRRRRSDRAGRRPGSWRGTRTTPKARRYPSSTTAPAPSTSRPVQLPPPRAEARVSARSPPALSYAPQNAVSRSRRNAVSAAGDSG